MAVDVLTRRINEHINIVEANNDEELILDSSAYGTRNITVDNFKKQMIGNNNISSLGDGTPTGAALALNGKIEGTKDIIGDTTIAAYGDGTVTGILDGFSIKNVEIPVAGWSSNAPYTNTISVNGITAQDKIICLGYVPSNTPSDNIAIAQAASRLDYGITGQGTITWYALEAKPTITFSVSIMKGY
jgi:hypothetical protein